jgi:hypothetical protein
MRSVLFVLTACAVIALAFWAYRENYRTQQALDVTEQLQSDIRDTRARLSVLRAEWAYLNRPDRLRDLADLNFDSLGLMPMAPAQFGRIDQVAFPLEEEGLLPITDPIEVSNMGERP